MPILKIPWIGKNVDSGFLLLIWYRHHDITEILLLCQWCKTTNKQKAITPGAWSSSCSEGSGAVCRQIWSSRWSQRFYFSFQYSLGMHLFLIKLCGFQLNGNFSFCTVELIFWRVFFYSPAVEPLTYLTRRWWDGMNNISNIRELFNVGRDYQMLMDWKMVHMTLKYKMMITVLRSNLYELS